MAESGMKKLEQVHIRKINARMDEIRERLIRSWSTVVDDVAAVETMEHLPLAKAVRLAFRPVKDGFSWGKPWGTAWFRVRFRIPSAFRGEPVILTFRTGGECLIFRDGQPVQALDRGRDDYFVTRRAKGGERIELYIEAGANSSFGSFSPRVMRLPEIAVFNRDVWDTYWDLATLAEMAPAEGDRRPGLPEGDTRRARIIYELNKAVDVFDYRTPSLDELRRQARAVKRMLKPLFDCPAASSAQTLACMGHAHIDVAWLWPLAETVRKCGRTFSNVLELMRDYPDFKFVQSQPQLYEFTRDRYPSLYRQIRRRVKSGQWVPTGGMWVEADCNVTGGESLIRQILFGTRFFRQEFGHEETCLWLPDVFGYSAALPQILRRSGISYFLTQKISWSQFSTFPYSSFHWEGIDGSTVLSHFPPVNSYNAGLDPREAMVAARNHREKDRSPIQAVPFGFGDGGGGPTREMLERLERGRNLEGMPKLESCSPAEFFARLASPSRDLPKWVGELYLEFHRGTYTTQAYNKRFNRLGELRLREAEMLSALALAAGRRYEQRRLNEVWKLLLLNQFHDIIPGSSIDEVYEESDRHYGEILSTAEGIIDRELKALAAGTDTRGRGVPVLAFNPLSWERQGVVAVPGLRRGRRYSAFASDGGESPVQLGEDGLARFVACVPSIGHRMFHVRPGTGTEASPLAISKRRMENERLRVDFDARGRLSRVYDKEHARDVLAPGAVGNEFILFEDKSVHCGSAWDIDIFYNDKILERGGRVLSTELVEQGPVRVVRRVTRAISRSVIRQDIILTAGSARLDFVTTVEWGDEKDVLLKVAFPVNVRSDKARYEIQFGNVERPTHWNRPQDFAMFEVPAQRWADLSEADYGVALLNDCKYGHDTRDNVMRLTLLRAPKFPGQSADVNKTHHFTYSILPHAGTFTQGVVRAGYELNVPVLAAVVPPRKGSLAPALARMSVSGTNVVIETIKKAEDDGGLIVRLYEAHGCRSRHTFRTSLPVARVWETDLMEREERPVALRGGAVTLDFKPYQIRTLKLVL